MVRSRFAEARLVTSTMGTHRLAPAKAAVLRTAIYTRQSVERAGDQALTSVQAQRAMVEAFVASQAGLGWQLLPTRYDDEGYSGATLSRPAFQRLLADVKAGLVDLVVTYRMDRLSRSQRDFLNLMHLFDEHGARWVSATESFSTARPEGRAMLSVLMTFAQMEREVTSERVKHKIAATRELGAWTGGRPPLGLDSRDGRLTVNEAEAAIVREIFSLYVRIGTLADLCHEVAARGWKNKHWVNRLGKPAGGAPFDKARLRSLLANPLYAGQIRCGDELRTAKHDAIIDRPTWDAVQAKLATKGPRIRRKRQAWSSLLGGLLFCGCGAAMTHHFTSRHGRQYHFYVCGKHIRQNAAACPGSRVRMDELDGFVVDHLRAIGRDRALVAATVDAARQREPALDEDDLRRVLAELTPLWEVMGLPERQRVLNLLLERVSYAAATHDIQLTLRDSGVRALARELSKEAAS
jgi:DNA invertase Pin-like site-specific DNA recombinase